MTDDGPKTPHDALVRAIFGAPAHMAEELRAVLPADVAAHVDLTSLAPLPAHFADSQLENEPVHREQIATTLWYIWRVGRVAPADLLEFTRSHAGPTLENIMKTAAEQLLDQGRAEGEARGEAKGRAEGEARGEAKGRAEALLKLMQLKFGAVSEDVAQTIRTASVEQLDRWLGRVLSAESCDELLRG